MWKLHEIQISLSIDNILLEHSHVHLFTYLLYDHFYATIAELSSCDTDWPTQFKLFTIWPFTKKVSLPLF